MFGSSEILARVLVEERQRATECSKSYREWCLTEYRREIRHG